MNFSNIKDKPFVKNASTIFAGSFFAQAIAAISPFTVTYFYAPGEFGKLTVALSVVAVLAGLFTLRHEGLIIIADDDKTSEDLFVTSTTLNVICNLIVLIALILIKIIWPSKIPNIYLLIPLGTFSFTNFIASREFLARNNKFKVDAKTNVLKSSVVLSLQLIFAQFNPIAFFLLFSKIIGETISTLINTTRLIPLRQCLNLATTKKTFQRFKNRTFNLTLSKLLQNVSGHGINYIWALALDLKTLGLFYLANKAVLIPSVFIGENLQKVFEQRSLKYQNRGQDSFRLFIKVILLQVTISSFLAVGLYIASEYLFEFLLPKKWVDAIGFIKILVPLLVVSIPANTIFSMYKINNIIGKYNIIEFAENTVKLSLIAYFAFNQQTTNVVYSYVWVGVTSYIVKFTVVTLYSRKYQSPQ